MVTLFIFQKQGPGKITFFHDGYYRGEWESDLMQGAGIMELSDGSVYDGEFYAGMVTFLKFYFTEIRVVLVVRVVQYSVCSACNLCA